MLKSDLHNGVTVKMAGASDPLEDVLSDEVDQKAVSDLVGSLESQLGDRKTPAASYSDGKRDPAAAAAGHLSGKVRDQVGSAEPPQQGHPKAGSTQEPGVNDPLSGQSLPSSASSGPTGTVRTVGTSLQAAGASALTAPPGPGPVTLSTQPPASFHRAAVLCPSAAPSSAEATRTSSPGSQGLNGSTGAGVPPPPSGVSSVISAGGSAVVGSMASQPGSPAVTLPGHPSPVPGAQNGLEPKAVPSPSASAPQVLNHSTPLMHAKMLVTGQTPAGTPVILTSTPPPPAAQSSIIQTQTGTSPGAKPVINGVAQPTVAVVRPPGAPVGGPTSIQQQSPGLVAGTTRAPTPQPGLTVRPQQQTTIQLPPGFTIPPGMVLVRTETGQLVMVSPQVLAQAQAKIQQGQTAVTQRPAAPIGTPTIRVSTATTAPAGPPTPRLASAPPTRIVQSPSTSSVQALTGAVSIRMATPQKTSTVITAGGNAKPAVVPPSPLPNTATPTPPTATPITRVTVVSQEMQENVKKCKNFLATLIKLASHNSPFPETSKNVKALVQDLLDAKIEPEEFTSRLQAELKSSPQPYLIPFLKKSLPALRQTLLNSQQSLMTAPPSTSAPPPAAPGSVTAAATIRPPPPGNTVGGAVRLNPPIANTTAVAVCRPGVQSVQTHSPVVINQTLRHPATFIRGPATIAGKTPLHLAAQANQKKLSDPGGGTFRDDDDINDVASMAGVNLSEENARILATSSELVGTKIRSCKDESFLPPGLLHRRILDTAKKQGVTEVPLDVVNLVSHATESRLRSLLEKVTVIAQHRSEGGKDEEHYEQTTDVRSQLRFFEQLERLEKQRKDEQEREILLKAAKSRARQEDPEQIRLKQKAKERHQQEQAEIRQRDANLTALAAIGPRKKRKLESGGGGEVASGSGVGSSVSSSPRQQQLRQRITRVNLRDFIFCLEQDRSTTRSLTLYKALLK
ncbi:transcription initiation factor TFIID subunit 4 [Austrofundulus limnaeus]|uniref:Transcription initiation factor TFIID subunit 4 n=1 Tax=Austrofundulus limnaeus TaxID=52670 RepID=A0A2I4CQH4_AUSLI|nr:PREDICTED: transcription initiation factor TFIID subunit 4-like [Austrofundulus limnaeus]